MGTPVEIIIADDVTRETGISQQVCDSEIDS
jgi:hypothetical protein